VKEDISVGYRYRRMTLNEENGKPPIDIVVRAEIDTYVVNKKKEKVFMLLKTFN